MVIKIITLMLMAVFYIFYLINVLLVLIVHSVVHSSMMLSPLYQNPQFWNIELPNGIQLSINSKNWDVDGSDAVIVDSVKEAINMVLEVV